MAILLFFPGTNTINLHNAKSNFFPYKLAVVNNRLFVELVCTGNKIIPEGAEIISINGVKSSSILFQLTERQVRDGFNETYPLWIIDNYFREYYSFIFGHPDQFNVQYSINNIINIATIGALIKDSINQYRQSHYPDKSFGRKPNEGILFNIDPKNNYACLTIRDFHKEILKNDYRQDFETEIKKAFTLLNRQNVPNLILDLRNNQGGNIEYGVYLLSWLLKNEFQVIDQYNRINIEEGRRSLQKTSGEALGMHKPLTNAFKGKLFVLINGGSFSNAGIVSTTLKQHDRAKFIGSETGGNNKILAGDVKEYSFPKTGIHIEIPTKQFLLNESIPLTGHGTMPDYSVSPTIENLLNGTDAAKDLAIKLILTGK